MGNIVSFFVGSTTLYFPWAATIRLVMFPGNCTLFSFLLRRPAAENNVSGKTPVHAEDINIYPNPVSDKLVIVFRQAVPVKKEIQIINASGKTFLLQSIQNNENGSLIFYLSKFSSGIYFIRVNAGKESQVFKIIKL